jgi:peptidyl-prolyl cis-trans isomerase SurA
MHMKNRFLSYGLLLTTFGMIFLAPSLGRREVYGAIIDRIVAVVNGDVITLSELEEKSRPVLEKYEDGSAAEAEGSRREILAQLLSQLIDEHLVQEEIQKLGIKVDDEEVEATIARICEQNNMTRDELVVRLSSDGVSLDDYKRQLAEQIQRSQLLHAQVQARIVITDEQIEAYMKEHPAAGVTHEATYLLQHICVVPKDLNDPAAREAARAKADSAMQALKKGEAFEAVARRYSDIPSAADGGYLGAFTLNEMAPFVEEAVKGLKQGEFSGIIDTSLGWQIFRLKDIAEARDSGMGQARREDVRQDLYREHINARFEEWLKELRSKSTIRILL